MKYTGTIWGSWFWERYRQNHNSARSLRPGLGFVRRVPLYFLRKGCYNEGISEAKVTFLKKLFFVMNPCAGMRKANKVLPEILSVFNRAGFDVITYITEARGDAAATIERRAKEMDLVVCCGGDGTFNEAVTGILRGGADVPIGYIPAGSTNDFAGSLRLPSNPVDAAREIVEGIPVAYDVGRFGGRYFSYVASFGAFTKASYSTPQSVKNALGHTAYILEGIQELSQIRNVHARLELADGRIIEDDFLFGAICNSTSVGGLLTLDPRQVDMRDGKFEILLVRAPRDLAELHECVLAVQKQVYNCRMITFCSSPTVKVTMDPEIPWTLDGEKAEGQEEVLAENLQQIFKLIKKEAAV